jgi:predicted nucleotidyltransferase
MNTVVERVVAWAKAQPEILAVYLYGSVVEDRINPLSDLDIALLLRSEVTKQSMWRLEDRWSALWPEVVDLRVLNYAPLIFQFEVTTRGKRLWVAETAKVAEQESLIWRKYWDEEARLAETKTHLQAMMEARNVTEQQSYQSTLAKIGEVHRRVREAAATTLRRLSK